MGIPFYVASLIKSHKHIQRDVKDELFTDVLAIDFNCFIHTYLKASNPIGSIMVALDELLKLVWARNVYIAFDGLVPYAKMVQQRYRRFRKPDGVEGFDKHQISPGTPFMRELAETLRFLFPHVVVSDTLERGEGEHKIFQWLRTLPEKDRKTICIYGLDADLILIAMAQSQLGDICLLREKQKEEGFSTFHINALKQALPIPADQFVRMSILCFGNDFMPNLAMFSLREDGYTRALFYIQQSTFAQAAQDEKKILLKRGKDSDRRILAPDGHALESRMALHLFDGVLDWEPVCYAFWKTYEWTYHYFTTSEVLDWNWVYPYPEAPLVATLEDFGRMTHFVWEHPEPTFTIDDQLQFILPEHSLKKSGLETKHEDELYNEDTDTRHPWMRRFVWETDPYMSLPWGKLTSGTETRPALTVECLR